MKSNLISNWVVQYDQMQFPKSIQGNVIAADSETSITIMFTNIFILDFKNKTVKLDDNTEYFLIGDGKRLILFDENECQAYENGEENEENFYEDEIDVDFN